MKITNKMGLPQAFVEMATSDYKYRDKRYSVSSLLKGVRQAILERRYHEEIEQDVSDMIWLLFGTAVHSVLDHHTEGDYEFKEEPIKMKVGEYTLSGRFDLYNAQTKIVTDYKTCSVWKIIYGDFEDWKKQLLIYAYMIRDAGFEVDCGEIVAIMKDHNKSKAKTEANYPQLPVVKIVFKFTEQDFLDIEKFIKDKFAEIAEAEKLPDNELPLCSPEERYNSGDKFAVKRKNRKTALRVLNSKEEAEEWMKNNGGDYIEVRPGEDKKCADYCSVCEFCSHYKNRIRKETA